MSAGREGADAIGLSRQLQIAILRLQREIAELPVDPARRRDLNDRFDALTFAAAEFSGLLAAATAVLDRLAVGIALLGDDDRVFWSNRYFDDILARDDGLAMVAGRLGAHGRDQACELAQLIARTRGLAPGADDRPPGVLAIDRHDKARPLLVAALRLERDAAPVDTGSAIVAVLVADPARPVSLPAGDLEVLFGLTPAESQIAALLAGGDRLDITAEKLRVTTGTARTHLKRIFEKTGTGRQSELSALLQTLHARMELD